MPRFIRKEIFGEQADSASGRWLPFSGECLGPWDKGGAFDPDLGFRRGTVKADFDRIADLDPPCGRRPWGGGPLAQRVVEGPKGPATPDGVGPPGSA
jgi:hypothetical protein